MAVQLIKPNIKTYIKSEVDKEYEKYKTHFEKTVLKDKRNDMFKVLVAPMRFGKTRIAIEHHIPFLFNNTNVNCIIFTSPLGSILKQKERLIKNTVNRLDGVEYCDDPTTALEALEDGNKVVLVMTCMKAWVGSLSEELFNNHLEKDKTAFIIDEAHTWTTDSLENLGNVIGGRATGITASSETSKAFKGKLYSRVKKFSKDTTHIYGLTATTNNQHKGYVKALGNMQFDVINGDFLDDGKLVKKLAYRLAWFNPDRVRLMDWGLYGDDSYFFNQMLSVHMQRENIIRSVSENSKLTGFIESRRKPPNTDTDDNILEIMELFKKGEFKAPDLKKDSFFYVIMTSDKIVMYSKNGKFQEVLSDEKEVYKMLKDQNHSLRYLVVKEMAKMGVDLPTTKLFFSFRQTEKPSKDLEEYGYILESTIQKFGRLLTPNSGLSEKEFFDEYKGDFRNVPNFCTEMNETDWWIPATNTNKRAMEEYDAKFAPRKPSMSDLCPTCNRPMNETYVTLSDDCDKLDEFLKVG